MLDARIMKKKRKEVVFERPGIPSLSQYAVNDIVFLKFDFKEALETHLRKQAHIYGRVDAESCDGLKLEVPADIKAIALINSLREITVTNSEGTKTIQYAQISLLTPSGYVQTKAYLQSIECKVPDCRESLRCVLSADLKTSGLFNSLVSHYADEELDIQNFEVDELSKKAILSVKSRSKY